MIGYWMLEVNDLSYGEGRPLHFSQLWKLRWILSSVHGAKLHFYLSNLLDIWVPRKVITCTSLHTCLNCYNIWGQMGIGSLERWMLLCGVLVIGFHIIWLGFHIIWQVMYSLMVLCIHPIATSCGYCNINGLLGINMPWYDWILDVRGKWSQLWGGASIAFLTAVKAEMDLIISPRGKASLLLVQFTWYLSS